MPRKYVKPIRIVREVTSFTKFAELLDGARAEFNTTVLLEETKKIADETILYRLDLELSIASSCDIAGFSAELFEMFNLVPGDKKLSFDQGVKQEVIENILRCKPKVVHLDLSKISDMKPLTQVLAEFIAGNVEIISLNANAVDPDVMRAAASSSLVNLSDTSKQSVTGCVTLNAVATDIFEICFSMFTKFQTTQEVAMCAHTTSSPTSAAFAERGGLKLSKTESQFLMQQMPKFVAFVYNMSTEGECPAGIRTVAQLVVERCEGELKEVAEKLTLVLPEPKLSVVVEGEKEQRVIELGEEEVKKIFSTQDVGTMTDRLVVEEPVEKVTQDKCVQAKTKIVESISYNDGLAFWKNPIKTTKSLVFGLRDPDQIKHLGEVLDYSADE